MGNEDAALRLAEKRTKGFEGFREFPYKDMYGNLTIGYGAYLEANPMPEPVARLWLELDLKDLEEKMTSKYSWFHGLSACRKAALLDLAYNVGFYEFGDFKKMIAAIEVGDFKTAGEEMLDSQWHKQRPHRSERDAHAVTFDECAMEQENSGYGV